MSQMQGFTIARKARHQPKHKSVIEVSF